MSNVDIEIKIREIYNWMAKGDNYKTGVSNNDFREKFKSSYNDAWRILKQRKRVVFFEDGKWHRWFN